ncbi:cysteine hydrolase [Xenophilus aerolatus]|nr:cysteine hydrolase [Xenophilus aerolatus]
MTAIYLVLDMQNDLVHADGPLGNGPLAAEVARNGVLSTTARAIGKAREAGTQIGFVRVAFSEDFKECPENSPFFGAVRRAGLLILGSWGAEMHESLDVRPSDIQIVKHRVSPFYGTALELLLRQRRVDRIYCSGVSTQAVVQALVRDAHDRDFEVVLLADACAAHSPAEHASSIASLGRFCRVSTVDEADFR